jgi:hypothetical protein
LSNQNATDLHASISVVKEKDDKSPDKIASSEVVLSHDELFSFPKVRKNNVDENCDIIYPTPEKTLPVKRTVFGVVRSPDIIHKTPATKSRKISLARQNKKHSKADMLKLGKHFLDKRNKQGMSLVDLLDNACSADVIEGVFSASNPELQNQDASPYKKIKLNGVGSIFTEDGQSSHGTNVQVFSEKSTVNRSPANGHASQDRISCTSVQDCTELDKTLQMPAAFLENSILHHPVLKDVVSDCSVTKAVISQLEDLNEPRQCTDVTDGTLSSNKILFSDVLQLNSNCGYVGSGNKVSGCYILSGKDRNQESDIVCNSTMLSKQAAINESSFKHNLFSLEAKCLYRSAESSDQCAGAICNTKQTAADTSAIQQVKTASSLSDITEVDHAAWLSFDSLDFFMMEDEETE